MKNAKRIAFLGLGTMGSPMAINLMKEGFSVTGHNRTQGRLLVKAASKQGVEIVPKIQDAVANSEIVCICVSDVKDVREVIFGPSGIIPFARPGTIILDFSTIGPQASKEFAERLKSYGLRYLDAPVSGGDVGAQNGTLTIMVGGEQDDYETCLPLLKAVGENITYCGEAGSGQAIKLCNQILCAGHMVALCEATTLVQKFDLDPNLMIEVCSTGAAGSWALSNLGPKIAASDFAPGFMVKHILKDLRLVQESLGEQQLPGISLATQMFKVVQSLGGAEQGTQAMIRSYRDL